ncbi:Lateral signaling target protein 2-like protein [Morus notabilis]|uniref:Lateral signaling target protein 2-like protein n=1 Tax=Morus notabilis TaxID=981085 RepID=W9QLU0_9ROSA|nr:Lateral signaling target protein 2-like protein [Morus notabilis]
MEGHDHLNSKIEAEETETLVSRVSGFSLRDETPKQNLDSKRNNKGLENHREHESNDRVAFGGVDNPMAAESRAKDCGSDLSRGSMEENDVTFCGTRRKYFYYDTPLSEETGVWIPVSVPPMLETDRKEWDRGFQLNGGYFPEGDIGWNHFIGEDKEMTMWDVMVEMLLAARGKVSSFASGDIQGCTFSWISSNVLEQAWQEIAQTLTEANFANVREILEAEPPKWLADSAASACMLCGVRFHPIMCSRHHCRFCGGIFCGECSKGRSLLPAKFRVADPQRVCDVCCVRLESVQPSLMDQVSHAAQLPTHDLTDLSTLRSWVNIPWGQSMEYEIYKAANTIRGYNTVCSLKPEKSIPETILRQAKGLAIITAVKVGVVVTYNVGTGLVIARREDGSWSPPSAASTFGIGWGAQLYKSISQISDKPPVHFTYVRRNKRQGQNGNSEAGLSNEE